MPSSNQLVAVSAVSITLTAAAAALYIFYQKSIHRRGRGPGIYGNGKRKGLWDGQAIWRQKREVLVVRNVEECEVAVSRLRQATRKVKILGLDCEWCSDSGGKPKPVALLQLAAANGLCVLVQLCHMEQIPQSLKELLAERSIIKVGVGVIDDAAKLRKDYNMLTTGCIDLRYIAVCHVTHDLRPYCYGAGLSRLAEILVGVTLDKSHRLRCSNWEASRLTPQQMDYAMNDAFIAVAIFFEILDPKLVYSGCDLDSLVWSTVLPFCQGIVDVKFKLKNMPLSGDNPSPSKRHIRRITDQVGTKPLSKAYKARQSIKYHNCKLLAPDGTLLCSCNRKKAEWYLQKDIGVIDCEEPFTVRLKFEPKGLPGSDMEYYKMEKENRCVVCGREDSYVKKYVVPHEYKRHFPEYLKNHASHDVLLLCLQCHQNSWSYDSIQRQRLVEEYNAPISSVNSAVIPDQEKMQVRSHAKGLLRHLKTNGLPEERVKELEKTIKDFYQVDEVTQELLDEAAQLQTKKPNKDYTGSHGEKVVMAIMEKEGCEGLVKFERRWRQHFVESMQPEFLPELWSVDHVHTRKSAVGRLKDLKNGLKLDHHSRTSVGAN